MTAKHLLAPLGDDDDEGDRYDRTNIQFPGFLPMFITMPDGGCTMTEYIGVVRPATEERSAVHTEDNDYSFGKMEVTPEKGLTRIRIPRAVLHLHRNGDGAFSQWQDLWSRHQHLRGMFGSACVPSGSRSAQRCRRGIPWIIGGWYPFPEAWTTTPIWPFSSPTKNPAMRRAPIDSNATDIKRVSKSLRVY